MLKENWRLISRIERICDIAIVIVSFFTAYYGRDSLLFWNVEFNLGLPFEMYGLAPVRDYFVILLVSLVCYPIFLNALGAYGSMRLSTSFQIFKISLLASLMVFFALAAVLFILKLDLSRSFIALFCVLITLALTGERYLVLSLLRYWRKRGRNFRNVIVCGIGEQALRFSKEILMRPELGIRVRAFAWLKDGAALGSKELISFKDRLRQIGFIRGTRVLIGTAAVEKALRKYAIDEILFTDVVDVMPAVEEMVLLSSEQGIRTTIAADLFSIGLIKSGISYFGSIPLIHFQTPPGDRWELAIKRLIDVVVAGLLLALLSPLLLMIGIAVRLTSPGPIIFSQRRMGLNGRIFNLYKFRSMVADAEKKLPKLLAMNEMTGPVFKIKDDPRVTKFGRILRRLSLDELPQLWNVLVGDMSLVGPRPPIPGEVSLYERGDRRRLSMRPGITCTWQVSGRNEIGDFDSWVKLDLEYIDNWSLTRDISLLLRTIPAVLFGHGAR